MEGVLVFLVVTTESPDCVIPTPLDVPGNQITSNTINGKEQVGSLSGHSWVASLGWLSDQTHQDVLHVGAIAVKRKYPS